MRRENRDLWLAIIVAVICAAVTLAVPVTAVRALFALPLCFVLPGYAITAAIFPERQLLGLQRALLTFALSFAALVLGSLVLDLAGGIRRGSWEVLLVVLIVAGCAVGMARREPLAVDPPPRRRLRLRPVDVIVLLLAGLIATSALVVSRVPLQASNAVGYTQLWMLSTGTPPAPSVRIGVVSAEKSTTTYRLVVSDNSKRFPLLDEPLTLRPGGGSQMDVPLTGVSGPRVRITAYLYRAGSSAVYRQTTATIASSGLQP